MALGGVKMEASIFKLVISQGIFAVLFVYLLFYILKENNKREKDYQNLVKEIISLAQKLNLKDYNNK